jgi:spore germination protein KA
MNLFSNINKIFSYKPSNDYNFILPNSSNNIPEEKADQTKLFPSISVNLEYLNSKFNLLINSDINIRKFTLTVRNKEFSSAIIYIDGIVDNDSINTSILSPLLLKNSITMKPQVHSSAIAKDISVKKVKKFNLEEFLYNNLIPQNNIEKATDFKTVVEKINSGFCILLVDTLNIAFCIESKNIPGRSVETAKNEAVIQGPQEAFVENIRTNTGLIRKIINNENLVIENTTVGKITSTQICICYLSNVANNDLVA